MDKEILNFLSLKIRRAIENIPFSNLENIEEIRIRLNKPLIFTINNKNLILSNKGAFSENLSAEECIIINNDDIEETFKRITASSVFAHTEELKQGFITVAKGARVGICGKLSEKGNISEITSLNIRIPREIKNFSDNIYKNYRESGLLIAGPPGSGKTTLLRDFIRKISDKKRVCVIDSRYELSGTNTQKKSFDLGKNTDIFISQEKALAIEICLRTLYPQVIAFDEIGNEKELEKAEESFFSGVEILTTAHIGKKEELLIRKTTKRLIKSGVISDIVLLDENKNYKFLKREELSICD